VDSCVPAVQAQLDKFEGVMSAEVSLEDASATVRVKKGVHPQDLADTVSKIGFAAKVRQ
jgi:copper chaperone CopZ